ncbi:MAG: enoyl-CoA hydratase family protein [Gammaproteobacteria bacterium]|nr:enoyl-CoA hydratase family protein [Gammaproteobacteria bacterium]
MTDPTAFEPVHFLWSYSQRVATITLNRPERKNPLTFESYVELRDTFRGLGDMPEVKCVVIRGAGGNFCSGGDVQEIIGPLVERDMTGLLAFTRLTGDLVKAMRACPQVVIAAVEGVCVGAGAIIAMAADLRVGATSAKTAFLFNRVGLAGCDMGACAMLPRIIGQGRAAELLFTGRSMSAEEGERWGFYNRIVEPGQADTQALELAGRIAAGPAFANSMTKTQLNTEWNVSLETAIEMEAQAQAICMKTKDFARAYHAFMNKQTPEFEGN